MPTKIRVRVADLTAKHRAQKRNFNKFRILGMLQVSINLASLDAVTTTLEKCRFNQVTLTLQSVLQGWEDENKILGIGGGKDGRQRSRTKKS